jgi:hypothetical protein
MRYAAPASRSAEKAGCDARSTDAIPTAVATAQTHWALATPAAVVDACPAAAEQPVADRERRVGAGHDDHEHGNPEECTEMGGQSRPVAPDDIAWPHRRFGLAYLFVPHCLLGDLDG